MLPVYPGFIAYLAGTGADEPRRRAAALLGPTVVAGVLTTMVTIGVLLSLLARPFARRPALVHPSCDGRPHRPRGGAPSRSKPVRQARRRSDAGRPELVGVGNVYGLLIGPVAMPSAGPFLVALLAISVGLADGLTRLESFVVYGLGVRPAARGAGRDRGQRVPRSSTCAHPASPGGVPRRRGAAHRDHALGAAGGRAPIGPEYVGSMGRWPTARRGLHEEVDQSRTLVSEHTVATACAMGS